MDIRRTHPWLVRKPNRPDPPERIRPKPDIVHWHDEGVLDFLHIPRRDAERIYDAIHDKPNLDYLTYVLGTVLGYDMTEFHA